MLDPVTNNARLTDFSSETLVKVPAEILFKKGLGMMQFNPAFVNFEVLAAHLLKSDEWLYGIYYGATYYGYLYQGEKLSLELQFDCVKNYLPTDRNDLPFMISQYAGKIEYHHSNAESYAVIGELTGKKVIQKLKRNGQ